MPIVRAGGVIWAPVCKELDWEQLIPHKPDKQLSDVSDVNLLLTVGGGTHLMLTQTWKTAFPISNELSHPMTSVLFLLQTENMPKYFIQDHSVVLFLFGRKDTLDLSKLDPSQAWARFAKIVDTELIWSSQMMFTLAAIAAFYS